jgi:hypothetical protein
MVAVLPLALGHHQHLYAAEPAGQVIGTLGRGPAPELGRGALAFGLR